MVESQYILEIHTYMITIKDEMLTIIQIEQITEVNTVGIYLEKSL